MVWLAILNKSWRQHPTKQQLYGYLPPIMKTIKVRRIRHARHCWRSRDELISDVLPWIPSHGRAKAGRPARTYIQQLCTDTECIQKTCQKQWTIGGGERGVSVLMARRDNDEDYYLKSFVLSCFTFLTEDIPKIQLTFWIIDLELYRLGLQTEYKALSCDSLKKYEACSLSVIQSLAITLSRFRWKATVVEGF